MKIFLRHFHRARTERLCLSRTELRRAFQKGENPAATAANNDLRVRVDRWAANRV